MPSRVSALLPGRTKSWPDNRSITDSVSPPQAGPERLPRLNLPVAIAIAVFAGTMFAPPHLMDDVDAVQAQIPRNMLESGDWVTPRLNGIADFEKPPMLYWMIGASYWLLGVSDWAARLPVVISAVLLCWLVTRIGFWAFGAKGGTSAGLCLATSAGLFLFSRVLFHDVPLTLALTLAMWAAMRSLDYDEPRPKLWAVVFWACLGVGVLIKGLIAVVLPAGTLLCYLMVTGAWTKRSTWERLRPASGILIMLLVAAPWHILAIMRHPPFFDFKLAAEPRDYRGFFWFYFVNEHVLRFLNLRYPKDYTSIPPLQFLALHLVWFFPWSVYLPTLPGLSYRRENRASRTRLFALCWAGVVIGFFCISTTLEYYSLPAYPAVSLLIGSALAAEPAKSLRRHTLAVAVVGGGAFLAIAGILFAVRGIDTPGDIASALHQSPEFYTMSFGHIRDLTIQAFAYLRGPLTMAGIAALAGVAGIFVLKPERSVLAMALMMTLFFHATRGALVIFDPYMGSFPLAAALRESPPGQLIVDDQYFAFSSVLFYANRPARLLNGRVMNLEYGSRAPGAPDVFITDREFKSLWLSEDRHYVVATQEAARRFEGLVGKERVHLVAARGGKVLLTNQELGLGRASTDGERPWPGSGALPDAPGR